MAVFFTLLAKLLPLYCIILLGYIANRRLKVAKEGLASLMMYIVSPLVIFNSIINTALTPNLLLVPLFFFLVGCTICLLAYWLAGIFWKDATRNLMGYTAGTTNAGYFSVPVAAALFNQDIVRIMFIAILGFIFFDSTLGLVIVAKGNSSLKESLLKLLRFPMIYAFIVGFTMNALHLTLPPTYQDVMDNFSGAFSVLGMMMIGLGIADMRGYKYDLRFVGFAFVAKFFFWPLLVISFIYLDKQIFHIFNSQIYQVMVLMSVAPIAVKTVLYATELRTYPEKAALATLLSTLFALFYIPLMVTFFHF